RSYGDWSSDVCSSDLYWVLAGGGWKNPVIKLELQHYLCNKLGREVTIKTADQIGWSDQAMEAQTFAYLALRSLLNLPLSIPKTRSEERRVGKEYKNHR